MRSSGGSPAQPCFSETHGQRARAYSAGYLDAGVVEGGWNTVSVRFRAIPNRWNTLDRFRGDTSGGPLPLSSLAVAGSLALPTVGPAVAVETFRARSTAADVGTVGAVLAVAWDTHAPTACGLTMGVTEASDIDALVVAVDVVGWKLPRRGRTSGT